MLLSWIFQDRLLIRKIQYQKVEYWHINGFIKIIFVEI